MRPELALTGDLMVGFPGETEADFRETLDLVATAWFMGLHVFRFSPRPRTAAARYTDQVAAMESHDRSRRLIDLGRRLKSAYEERFHGKRLAVIWDRQFGGLIRGVSENYIQVAAPAAGRRAGELEEVVWQPASSAP